MTLALPCYALLATERYTLLARLVAWLGFGLALLPTLVMVLRPQSPPCGVAATGLVIAFFYHLGVFHERRLLLRWGMARISDDSVELALLLAALATPCMWLGWFLVGRLRPGRILPQPRLELAPRTLRAAGVAIILWSLLADALWIHGQLTTYQPAVSVIQALAPLELGFALLVVHRLGGHATLRDRVLFGGWMVLVGCIALARGMIMVIIRPFLIFLLGWLYLARRIRLMPVLAVLAVVLLMQPVKGEFRQRIWDRPVEMGIAERALLYLSLMERHWLGSAAGPPVDAGQSLQRAAARTGASLPLAHIMELTPASVPYQRGATYRYLLYTFVPRFLYPDKPIAQQADVWAAIMYGYTTERGTAHVMVGLSQMGEAFINFGFLGALGFLVLLGGLYRICDEVLLHPGAGSGSRALYLFYLLNAMIGSEGSFAQFWGGVIQTFLFYGAGLWVLAVRRPLAVDAGMSSRA
ncbi:MAG: hypothetical protein RMK29_13000 [Myxococcales bacterium]|nr:hypothetical protein [Myxococcota bacterium]MDW8282623.1 hypothetical protein [Myxococcales bacterium]